MAYSIKFNDSRKQDIVVNDQTTNKVSTSLTFVGRNYPNYGTEIATNFLALLENFSNATAPARAIEGQIWFDNVKKQLMVNDSTSTSSNWRPASGTHVGASDPSNAIQGDLWVNTRDQQLSLYNGSSWVLVGPSTVTGRKTGSFVETIVDSYGTEHYVITEYVNDSILTIKTTETFIPQQSIEGFVVLQPGINYTTKTFIGIGDTDTPRTEVKIVGLASVAESIKVTEPTVSTVLGNNLARKDVSNILLGQQTIRNDSGVTIGTAQNFSIGVNSGNGVITNATDGGNIDFRIANSGLNNLLIRVDGRNKRVGINHPTPNVELDVNGSAYISGTLKANGTVDATSLVTGAFQVAGGAAVGKNLYVGGNLNANGHLAIGELDTFGQPVAGVAINPKAGSQYDIGTATNKFRNVYAETFNGVFNGTFTSNSIIQAQGISGTAARLASPTIFKLGTGLPSDVSEMTSPGVTFDGSGGVVALVASLSEKAITKRTEAIESRGDDTLLVYRSNTGLRKMTRSTFLSGEAFIPIGTILPYAGTTTPSGYLFCDGSLVSRANFPGLFVVVGTTYGQGLDPLYFRVPDLRGRFALGSFNMQNNVSFDTTQVTTTVVDSAIGANTLKINDGLGIVAGMLVTGNGIPSGTVTTSAPISVTEGQDINFNIGLSQPATVAEGQTITFSVATGGRTAIDPNTTTRVAVSNTDSNPGTIGGVGGFTETQVDIRQGSNSVNVPTGSGSTIARTQDLPIVNPYMTINYIIRAQ